MVNKSYDFGGWATKSNIKCSDGRTILPNAFKHNDGKTVPLVWNHKHSDVNNVLGHAELENRPDGVYAYCTFNDTQSAQNAKLSVMHGDITSLSIHANRLKQTGSLVSHGEIRELSLVLAGANPGAYIDSIMMHSDDDGEYEEAVIYNDEMLDITHAEESEESEEETVKEVFDSMNEKQKKLFYAFLANLLDEQAEALKHSEEVDTSLLELDNIVNQEDITHSEGSELYRNNENVNNHEGELDMPKSNVFEKKTNTDASLSHADGINIVELAKNKSVGSLQEAIDIFIQHSEEDSEIQNGSLSHAFDDISTLFPEFKDVRPGMPPERIDDNYEWVNTFIAGVHKSPHSRIRSRQTDMRGSRANDVRGKGYKKGEEKTEMGNWRLLSRTTDPQTVYVKDKLHRDDIIDVTDFDYVNYNFGIMKEVLNQELAIAALIGDGRESTDDNKIDETHIRSILNDDELYTIHHDVNFTAAATKLQGSGTSTTFGENYIKAEAMVEASLYSREQYKGSGNLVMFIEPHMMNVMLLARDMNGRRIYDSKADVAKALNVSKVVECEQLEGATRTTSDNKTKAVVCIMVNLKDYQFGATKGGEITKFRQFDIDFNGEKMLIETRLSGALTRVKSAICIEEDVTVETVG